jgi:GT2 family glycosyltransferase
VVAGLVNHDGAELTLEALASLSGQGGADRLQIVVIDNGSAAADLAALEAGAGERARVVRLPVNLGYAAACNAVSRIAADSGADFVWWLNNDLRLEPGALDALLEEIEGAPRAAAVAAVTTDYETGRLVLGAGMDLSLWRGRVRHSFAGLDIDALPPGGHSVEVVAGACLLVRMSALHAIGGMDEAYFMYGEDVDWSIRARAAGFDLHVVHGARARHGWARSSAPADRLRFLIRNRIRLVRARAGAAAQLAFIAYFVLGWLPAYTLARLVPRFGIRAGLRLAIHPLAWNIGDALRRRRWRLRLEDQAIPRI